MKIYLVGGAVRDALLEQPITERDWVVVGGTPQELQKKGYHPVGKDFPVFLHPETKEEYALARMERKVAPGYTGFTFNTSPLITLEEDLQRRDLTINAMAKTEDGLLIDPFGGKKDLEKKILRHVSPAFSEDPVRLLRVARFAARFPDFTVAPETHQLMRTMVINGEVTSLVPERVWQELYKVLSTISPNRFFEVLTQCEALPIIFPLLNFNFLAQQALIKASAYYSEPIIRFATLMHQTKEIKKFCQQLRVPKDFSTLANLVHKNLSRFPINNKSEEILALLETMDAFRRPQRFHLFVDTITACLPNENTANKEKQKLLASLSDCQTISAKDVDPALQGIAITKAIHSLRLKKLAVQKKQSRNYSR